MPTKEDKKTVKVFGFASFLNDMGSDMIYPIWPLFVTSFAGANMAVLGLIDGLGDGFVSISQAVSGYLSDRMKKRKVFVWLGYFLAFLSRIGYAFSSVWHLLVPFKVLDRFGKMRGAPRDAMVADSATDKNRGSAFGFLRMMDNLGAVCGIIASMVLVAFLSYRKIFLIAAIPSIFAVVLVLLFIKEKPSERRIAKGISFRNLSGNFKRLTVISAIFALGSFSYSFLLIYARDLGFQPVVIPVFYLIFTLAAFFFSLPFGKLADRIGRRNILMISFLLWALVCISILVTKHILPGSFFVMLIIVFVLYGMHRGAIDVVQRAFVAELAPKEFRASSLGGFQMVVGLCALPSSLIAGLLWDNIGLSAPLILSLCLTVISMALLTGVKGTSAFSNLE